VLVDRLGSTKALLQSGNLTSTYNYDVDGNADKLGTGPTSVFKYAGGQTIGGLVHFARRYYDPATATWTQPDPLEQIADLSQANRYLYVGSDPTNFVDPTGQCKLLGIVDPCGAARHLWCPAPRGSVQFEC